jgi:hypothetical protein
MANSEAKIGGPNKERRAGASADTALSFGPHKNRVAFNPAKGLGSAQTEHRIRGTIAKMETLLATANALGRDDATLLLLLGLFTGQRQADRLKDQDFRDTAVTSLAKAGASIPEITSITGSSSRDPRD